MSVDREQLDAVIAAQTNELKNVQPVPAPAPKLTLAGSVTTASGPASNLAESDQLSLDVTLQGAGVSLGNAGGWTVGKSIFARLKSATRGIHQFFSFIAEKTAAGDFAGIYGYITSDGGISAASDEGVTSITLEQSEYLAYFHGTVAKTTGRGDRSPAWAFSSGNNWTTDNAFMLNISAATIATNVIASSQPLADTFLNYLPVKPGSLPITNAWGIATAAIPNLNTTRDTPVVVSVTVTLKQIGGNAKPFVPGHCVVAGIGQPEQSIITAVTAPTATGQQTLTLALTNPNAQAIIFQGGIAGTYISAGANLRFSGMRSSYFAFGSLTGDDLIYGVNVGGSLVAMTLPQDSEAFTADGGPNSDVLLCPGAEIVCNPVYKQAKGTLEQNNVDWTNATVENPHYPVWGGHAAWFTKYQITPSNSRQGSVGLAVDVGGPGFGGGNTYLARLRNANPPSNFKGNNGPIVAPDGLHIEGPLARPVYISNAHEPGGAMTQVQGPCNPNLPNADILDKSYSWLPGANFWFRDGMWWSDAPMAASAFAIKGTPGWTGTYLNGAGETVTVEGGIIISVK